MSPHVDVLIVGGGHMGSGIAAACALAGHRARIVDATPELTAAACARAKQRAGRVARSAGEVLPASWSDDLRATEVCIEAVRERFEDKVAVLRQAAESIGPDALLATNTSSLSVGKLASASCLADRLVGLHFFSPAHRSRVVEVVRGVRTEEALHDQAVAFASSLGKETIVVDDAPGFLVNRLARPLYLEAERLVEAGASPHCVDAIMRGVGFPVGPLEIVDRVGLDVHDAVSRQVYAELLADRFRPVPIVSQLVRRGMLGVKSGSGFHRYEAGRRIDPDPPPNPAEEPAVWADGLARERLGGDLRFDSLSGRVDIALVAYDDGPLHFDPGVVRVDVLDLADVVVDGRPLVRRPAGGDVIELAAAAGCAERLSGQLASVLGLPVFPVPRLAGLVAHRILAAFVNEAALVVQEGYATRDEAERAVRLALGHTVGPFGWLDRLGGPAAVVATLDGLHAQVGAHYYPAPWLRELAYDQPCRR